MHQSNKIKIIKRNLNEHLKTIQLIGQDLIEKISKSSEMMSKSLKDGGF